MEDKNNYSDYYYPVDEITFHPEMLSHQPYDNFNSIRLSIFFITAVCVGLPCLIWAFYFVHLQRKTRGRISTFILLLLLSDLLQLLLYPYIVSTLLSSSFFHAFDTVFIAVVFFGPKIYSLHLQQLVALEWILTLKYPQMSARVFLCPCYSIISIIILLVPLLCLLPYGAHLSFGSVLAPMCLLVVTGIITYKAPPTPASTPATDNRPDASLFLVNTVTLVVLYLPCVLVHCVQYILFHISVSCRIMSHCLLSLTVISEPLLCVLVCRQNLSTQIKQTHIELNSEQTAV